MKLSAVTSGVARGPDRILMYGVGGCGKTTFFAEAPRPIFLDTQEGTTRLDVGRFPQPRTWEDVHDAVDELLSTQHQYQSFIIDLLDDVEQMLFASLCKRDGVASIGEYGGGYNKGFDAALAEWRVLVAKLERLQSERGMLIGMVAHCTTKTIKNPEGEDYDRYTLLLAEKSHGFLRGWCDTVLLARHEVVLRTDRKKRTRGISTGARVIHTVETAAYVAKNRDNLPDTLPLDWTEFRAAIAVGAPASPEAVRAEIAELAQQVDEATRAKVQEHVAASGEDAPRLARILNKLRERVQPQQSQQTQESTQ